MITADDLRRMFHYDQWTGNFIRLTGQGGRGYQYRAGDVAGTFNRAGYRQIKIHGHIYYSHRLAWLWMTGSLPGDQVDHINGVKGDNRWANLRAATRSLNQQNLRVSRRDNSTGMLGVFKARKMFGARIQISGKKIYLGQYANPSDAHAVYLAAKRSIHPGCTI